MDKTLPCVRIRWGRDFEWQSGFALYAMILPWPADCQRRGALLRGLLNLKVGVSRDGVRVNAYTPCRAEYELRVGEFA